MLQTQAARLLQVTPEQLAVQDRGFQVIDDPTQRVDFATVAASTTEWEAPETDVPLKSYATYKTIGQPLPRVDIPDKVTGATVYAMDARVEGMKYGAVVRPPSIDATLKSIGPGTAADQPGVVDVVVLDGQFGGVVADSRLAAEAAVGKMAAEWDSGLSLAAGGDRRPRHRGQRQRRHHPGRGQRGPPAPRGDDPRQRVPLPLRHPYTLGGAGRPGRSARLTASASGRRRRPKVSSAPRSPRRSS